MATVAGFPWTTLITAAGTLSGALGAVGLKARYDVRNEQRQDREKATAAHDDQKRAAYTSLLVAARQLSANLAQMRKFYSADMHDAAVAALNSRMDSRSDQLSQAAATVDLLASEQVRIAERELAEAAQIFTIFRVVAGGTEWRLDTPGGYDEAHIEEAAQRLSRAITAFADVARTEVEAGSA